MTSKLKKVKAANRFGARYGKRARDSLVAVETKQRVKQKCPFVKKLEQKDFQKEYGNVQEKNVVKKFASNTYHLS